VVEARDVSKGECRKSRESMCDVVKSDGMALVSAILRMMGRLPRQKPSSREVRGSVTIKRKEKVDHYIF
jgi:hypothetical protein